MRQRLKTTWHHLLRAAILGALTPTAVFYLFMVFVVSGGREPASERLMTLAASALLMAFFLIPGLIGWIVMHRFGTRIKRALLVGTLLGTADALIVALIAASRAELDWQGIVVIAFFALGGAILGALTTALVWLVAYPRNLQANTGEVLRMKRARLVTRPSRLALAFAAGTLCLTVLIAGYLTLRPIDYGQGAEAAFPFLGSFLSTVILSLSAAIFLMFIPIAPLWILAYARRANRLAVTLLSPVIFTAMTFRLWKSAEDPASALLIVAGCAVGASVTAFCIWTLAYPKALQDPSPAEAF